MKRLARIRVTKDQDFVYENFPRVYKHKNGTVQIIYKDRVEFYKPDGIYRDDEYSKYDPENEIAMAEGNNAKQVHYKDDYTIE